MIPRILGTLFIAALACATASAQLSLSYLSGNAAAPSGTGQSFTPADAGTFPGSVALLTEMTFQTGDSSLVNSGAAYLSIYSDSGLTSYIGSSTNSQTWVDGQFLQTKTFSFDDLELNAVSTYYAVFSTAASAGGIVNRTIEYASGDPYSGGKLIYNSTLQNGLDANFTATFSTSAVPEPSTYALVAGLAVLGCVAVRRRRG